MRRTKNRLRRQKKVYAIVVEGQTEQWYFQLMSNHEKSNRINIRPELPTKRKLNELFDLVSDMSKIREYDKIFWVLDLDVIIRDGHVAQFKKYYTKLKTKDNVVVIANNPCLEFWFLLHFKETGRYFPRCSEVVNELKKCEGFASYNKTQKYFMQNKRNIYQKLKPFQGEAITRAKKLGRLDFANLETAKAEMYIVIERVLEG